LVFVGTILKLYYNTLALTVATPIGATCHDHATFPTLPFLFLIFGMITLWHSARLCPLCFTIFSSTTSCTSVLPLFPSVSPLFTLQITTVASEGDVSCCKSIPPDQTHKIDRGPVELQEQVKKQTQDAEQVRRFAQRNPYWRAYDVSDIDFIYSSSHEDFDDEEEGHRRKFIQGMTLEILKLRLRNWWRS